MIEQLIGELREQVAVVIVTHILQQAFRVADRVAFMYLGELVEYGPAEQVFERPRHSRTAAYVSGAFGCGRSPRRSSRSRSPAGGSTQAKSARLERMERTPPWEQGVVAAQESRDVAVEGTTVLARIDYGAAPSSR